MGTSQDLGLVTAYGYAKAGGYTGTEAEFEDLIANLPRYATAAATSATNAAASATAAANSLSQTNTVYSYTVSEYNKTVTEAASAAEAENKAEEYASAAATSMAQAATSAASAVNSALSASTSETNAQDSATAARNSATSIGQAETRCSSYALTAESCSTESRSWAIGGTGTRSGEDTNNARYWSEQAAHAAGGGVVSFNDRSGSVLPIAHDYNAGQIDYDNTTSGLTATNLQAAIDEILQMIRDITQ